MMLVIPKCIKTHSEIEYELLKISQKLRCINMYIYLYYIEIYI
jgi:hypothetical protein